MVKNYREFENKKDKEIRKERQREGETVKIQEMHRREEREKKKRS